MQKWTRWGEVANPAAEAAGIRFDHEPSGPIRAPEGKLRVCAYHFDFDERPTCYVDVDTREEAEQIIANFSQALTGGWNVDYAAAYDPAGEIVVHNRPY